MRTAPWTCARPSREAAHSRDILLRECRAATRSTRGVGPHAVDHPEVGLCAPDPNRADTQPNHTFTYRRDAHGYDHKRSAEAV